MDISMRGIVWLTMLCGVLFFGAVVFSACYAERPDKQNAPEPPPKQGPRLTATCEYSHTSEADPIFKPTTHPPAHLHDFFGNTTTKQSSTYQSLRKSKALCRQPGDHSAWWATALYAGNTKLQPKNMLIYYQIIPGMSQQLIHAFPANFRDISRTPKFRCGDSGEFKKSFGSCSADNMDVRLTFDACYNPQQPKKIEENTAKPVGGRCPSTHPLLLSLILVQTTYPLQDGARSNFTVPGNTGDHLPMTNYHVDFINAWNQDQLKKMVVKCLKETGLRETRPQECRFGPE